MIKIVARAKNIVGSHVPCPTCKKALTLEILANYETTTPKPNKLPRRKVIIISLIRGFLMLAIKIAIKLRANKIKIPKEIHLQMLVC